MKPDEFDLQLMDEMSQLPPPAPEVHDYTPGRPPSVRSSGAWC